MVLRLVDDAHRRAAAPRATWPTSTPGTSGPAGAARGRPPAPRPRRRPPPARRARPRPGIVDQAIADPTTHDEVRAEHDQVVGGRRLRRPDAVLPRRPVPLRAGAHRPAHRGRGGRSACGTPPRRGWSSRTSTSSSGPRPRPTAASSPRPSSPTSRPATGSASTAARSSTSTAWPPTVNSAEPGRVHRRRRWSWHRGHQRALRPPTTARRVGDAARRACRPTVDPELGAYRPGRPHRSTQPSSGRVTPPAAADASAISRAARGSGPTPTAARCQRRRESARRRRGGGPRRPGSCRCRPRRAVWSSSTAFTPDPSPPGPVASSVSASRIGSNRSAATGAPSVETRGARRRSGGRGTRGRPVRRSSPPRRSVRAGTPT